jgi:hypothetical protein
MGLTYQSSRLQASMSEHLVKMGEEASRAAKLHAAADAEWSLSTKTHEKAGVDKVEGEAMHKEAEALFVKVDQDEAVAATEEETAEGETAKAAGEEEQAVAHFAEAGSLQTIVDADRIEAFADSSAATRAAFTARGDELGTGICEIIPLLDVLCDIIGGTAAFGLETMTAKEAAESAALIAAATEAEAKEKSELALAIELQTAAVEDGELAAADHAASAELEAEAEAEMEEAEEEEAAAQEKLEQSALEEEAAEQEKGEALEEEEQSGASFAKSAAYGVAACWDACWATLVAAVAAGFFAARLVPTLISSASEHVSTVAATGFNTSMLRRISQGYHHCVILGMTLGFFGSLLMEFDSLHVRARGGIVLLIALDAAIIQAALVHALPKVWSSEARSTSMVNNFSQAFLQSFFFRFPLFVLEFLILRVTFGQSLLSVNTLKWLQQWYVWIIVAATLFAHHCFLERQERVPSEIPLVQVSVGCDSLSLSSSSASSYGSVANKSLPSSLESVSLTSSVGTEERTAPAPRRHVAILNYFRQYQLLFDLLIASCAFAVLRTCLPNVKHLWPVSKTIILAAHPHWWLVAVVGGIALVGTCVFVLLRKRQTA